MSPASVMGGGEMLNGNMGNRSVVLEGFSVLVMLIFFLIGLPT